MALSSSLKSGMMSSSSDDTLQEKQKTSHNLITRRAANACIYFEFETSYLHIYSCLLLYVILLHVVSRLWGDLNELGLFRKWSKSARNRRQKGGPFFLNSLFILSIIKAAFMCRDLILKSTWSWWYLMYVERKDCAEKGAKSCFWDFNRRRTYVQEVTSWGSKCAYMVLYDRENNGYIFYFKSKIIITFESLACSTQGKRGFFFQTNAECTR